MSHYRRVIAVAMLPLLVALLALVSLGAVRSIGTLRSDGSISDAVNSTLQAEGCRDVTVRVVHGNGSWICTQHGGAPFRQGKHPIVFTAASTSTPIFLDSSQAIRYYPTDQADPSTSTDDDQVTTLPPLSDPPSAGSDWYGSTTSPIPADPQAVAYNDTGTSADPDTAPIPNQWHMYDNLGYDYGRWFVASKYVNDWNLSWVDWGTVTNGRIAYVIGHAYLYACWELRGTHHSDMSTCASMRNSTDMAGAEFTASEFNGAAGVQGHDLHNCRVEEFDNVAANATIGSGNPWCSYDDHGNNHDHYFANQFSWQVDGHPNDVWWCLVASSVNHADTLHTGYYAYGYAYHIGREDGTGNDPHSNQKHMYCGLNNGRVPMG